MDEVQAIPYPKITVPGRGSFEVKFGVAAARIVARDQQLDGVAVLDRLRRALPKDDPSGLLDEEGKPKRVMGEIQLDFLFDLLSACTWGSAHMTASELAQAFDDEPLFDTIGKIVGVLIVAVSKTKWSAHLKLQETATPPQEHPTLN